MAAVQTRLIETLGNEGLVRLSNLHLASIGDSNSRKVFSLVYDKNWTLTIFDLGY